jgi:hypothetical protein
MPLAHQHDHEQTRIITVRMPKALRERFLAASKLSGESMNKLSIEAIEATCVANDQ